MRVCVAVACALFGFLPLCQESQKEEWQTKASKSSSKQRFAKKAEKEKQAEKRLDRPCHFGQFCLNGNRCTNGRHPPQETDFFTRHNCKSPFKVNPLKSTRKLKMCPQDHQHKLDLAYWAPLCDYLHTGEEAFCLLCREVGCICELDEAGNVIEPVEMPPLIEPNDEKCKRLKKNRYLK